jgi:hypothetical protein
MVNLMNTCLVVNTLNSCLTEMEKLQAKVMELQKEKELMEQQKQKRLEKQKEEKKTNEIEPNLYVMEKWLDAYYENEEQKKMAKVAMDNFNNWTRYDNRMNRSFTKEEQEEFEPIKQNYMRFYSSNPKVIMKPIESFEPKKNLIIDKSRITFTEPSDFMIQYIESTYNLFKIQQKQIDELQSVVAVLKGTEKNEKCI